MILNKNLFYFQYSEATLFLKKNKIYSELSNILIYKQMFSMNVLWKLIFVRSRGAIVVFATAPATAPAARDVMILLCRGILQYTHTQ